jgi:hypothetical protein
MVQNIHICIYTNCMPSTVALNRFSRYSSSVAKSTEDFGSIDHAFEKDRIKKQAGDPSRREFTYFMLGGARFIYASAARLALIKVSIL